MKKLLLGSLIGLALAASGQAQAADMYLKTPPVAPAAIDWSGFYIGGHAGFAASNIPFTFTDDVGNAENLLFTPGSYIGGAQFGVQWQYDQWVLGLEGTWSSLHMDETVNSTVTAGEFHSIDLNQIATATFRFGATWNRALFYAKAGYATAHLAFHSVDTGTGLTADSSKWRNGWTAGLGVDYMLLENVVVGAEFDYYNFNFDNTIGLYSDGATQFSINGSNGNVYAIMARASYLFR